MLATALSFAVLAAAIAAWGHRARVSGLAEQLGEARREAARLRVELHQVRQEAARDRAFADARHERVTEARIDEARAYVNEVARLRGGRPAGEKRPRPEDRASDTAGPKTPDRVRFEALGSRAEARTRYSQAYSIPIGQVERLISARLIPHPKLRPRPGEVDPPPPDNWMALLSSTPPCREAVS